MFYSGLICIVDTISIRCVYLKRQLALFREWMLAISRSRRKPISVHSKITDTSSKIIIYHVTTVMLLCI